MRKKFTIIMLSAVLLIAGYFVLDRMLFDGVRARAIQENGCKANFFAQAQAKKQTTVVLLGGGNWGDFWGQEFAKNNYTALSLPYYRREGLPQRLEEIPLEYVKNALDWLAAQPEVNPDKIVVMGASRNAELALLVASYYPEDVHGAIAYSPSSVSWANRVLPFNSDTLKSSWTYKNKAVPYMPMRKIIGNPSDTIETLSYWTIGLLNNKALKRAYIPVERINGPVLLFSGLSDAVWPSAMMSDMIAYRLENSAYKFAFENVKYENAGHLISSNPNNASTKRQGELQLEGKTYKFHYGGTTAGDMAAQQDAYNRVFQFLEGIQNAKK